MTAAARAAKLRRRTLARFRRLGERLVAEGRPLSPYERVAFEKAKVRLGLAKPRP